MIHPLIFPLNGPKSYRFTRFLLNRQVAAFEHSLVDPEEAQSKVLSAILRGVRGTVSAEQHGLNTVQTLIEYRSAVPIQSYEEIEPLVDRILKGERRILSNEKIQGFVETSGTQSTPKLIPITKSWARQVRQAQLLWMLGLLRDFPSISKRDVFHIVSSAEQRTIAGFSVGANTGRMVDALPNSIQKRFVLREIPEFDDPNVRHYVHLRFALQHSVGLWITANPSTIALYCRKLTVYRESLLQDLSQGTLRCGPAQNLSESVRLELENRLHKVSVPMGHKPAEIWPLSVIGCWTGGPARWFVDQFSTILGGDVAVRDVGLTASEGYFAIPLSSDWEGGVLWNNGELLEFQAEDGRCYWGWELEKGTEYKLVISARNGLLRYAMKDTIRVTGYVGNTPIVVFVGKSGRYLNSVGEKVTEEQLSLAMDWLSDDIIGFTGSIQQGEVPSILIAIEWTAGVGDTSTVAEKLDRTLQSVSVEYRSKRQSQRMAQLRVCQLREGAYDQFRAWRISNGASYAQVKDCMVATNEEWMELQRSVIH
jgi:hypothetical protein